MHQATYTQNVYGANFSVYIILMLFASYKSILLMWFLGKSLYLQIGLSILEERIKAPSLILLTWS